MHWYRFNFIPTKLSKLYDGQHLFKFNGIYTKILEKPEWQLDIFYLIKFMMLNNILQVLADNGIFFE